MTPKASEGGHPRWWMISSPRAQLADFSEQVWRVLRERGQPYRRDSYGRSQCGSKPRAVDPERVEKLARVGAEKDVTHQRGNSVSRTVRVQEPADSEAGDRHALRRPGRDRPSRDATATTGLRRARKLRVHAAARREQGVTAVGRGHGQRCTDRRVLVGGFLGYDTARSTNVRRHHERE